MFWKHRVCDLKIDNIVLSQESKNLERMLFLKIYKIRKPGKNCHAFLNSPEIEVVGQWTGLKLKMREAPEREDS